MEEIQRTRILEAIAKLTAERGAGEGAATVTIAHIVERAGVSRATFYELFADREACLVAAFDLGVERATARIVPAYTGESRWRDGLRAGMAAFLAFLEDEPALARLCVVHAMGGGPVVLAHRTEVLERLWEVVDRGRLESSSGKDDPPAVMAEGVVGAVLSVVQNRLQSEVDERPLMELFGPLMSLLLLPYLGSSAARRELTRPPPRVGARLGETSSAEESRFEDPGVRLTYRTARVLTAIAEFPGASNREVAERAGIVDQGQISKLLGRLEAQGLIAKMGDVSSRGAPNAWRLTDRGERIERVADGRSPGGSPQLRR